MSLKKTGFLCIGLIMHDFLIQGISSLPKHWEDMVAGETTFSDTGGGAANSARTFGRLGADVAIAGRIGCDSQGDQIRQSLEDDHVSTRYLVRDSNTPSGLAAALVNHDGQRCFATVQGCNRYLCLEDFETVNFADYNFIHVNGYFQFPSLEKDMVTLLGRAKKENCVISFDTASWDPTGRWYASIRPFASLIDYFFSNETQLLQLTGKHSLEEAVKFLLADQVKHVIVKRGERGCIFYDSEMHMVETPSYSCTAVDTTGAGDSFDAAYMLGISKGWSPERCGVFATTVAGLNCERPGATSGVPDYRNALKAAKLHIAYNNKNEDREEIQCHL